MRKSAGWDGDEGCDYSFEKVPLPSAIDILAGIAAVPYAAKDYVYSRLNRTKRYISERFQDRIERILDFCGLEDEFRDDLKD